MGQPKALEFGFGSLAGKASNIKMRRPHVGSFQREIAVLRCGPDRALWYDERALTCAELLKLLADKIPKESDPLHFDLSRAHVLYKALFGQVEDDRNVDPRQ